MQCRQASLVAMVLFHCCIQMALSLPFQNREKAIVTARNGPISAKQALTVIAIVVCSGGGGGGYCEEEGKMERGKVGG